MPADREIVILTEALALERDAVRRYAGHLAGTQDPRLIAYWEALRRNECGHRDALLEQLARMAVAPPAPGTPATPAPAARTPEPEGETPHTRGYRSALAALAGDLEFERGATRLYGRFANEAVDATIRELFMEFARGEAGHVRGVRKMTEMLTGDESPVLFFCPLCGWEVSFGRRPAEGARAKCPMCSGRFALRLRNGDWLLERTAP